MIIIVARKGNSIIKDFGIKVRELRKEKGWNQDQLAEAAGTSRVWISNVETGVATQLSLDVAYRIAKSLGVTINYLLGEETVISEDEAIRLLKKAIERDKEKSTDPIPEKSVA